jgi:hypothetical protein
MINNASQFEKWADASKASATLATTIRHSPAFLASHQNYLFCVDDLFQVKIYALSFRNEQLELNEKNPFKIPIPNVQSVALNANYFAVTYFNLDKKYLKKTNFRYKPSGVVLYKRVTADMVDVNYEKPIELDYANFSHPIGVALDADFLYVCDKGLRAVVKIDLASGNTVGRVEFDATNEPYKVSVNREYLVVSVPSQHKLCVYNVNILRDPPLKVGVIKVTGDKSGSNGPHSVVITEDSTIFFKNYPESQLTIVDRNLNRQHLFTQIQSAIQGFAIVDCSEGQKVLVVGTILKKDQFKLLCFCIN